MAKLKIKDERGKEWVHELIDDVTTVGRSSRNVIQVTDEKASRQHFRVEKFGARFKVIDLGSTNGVCLNGVKIQGEAILKPGDEMTLGKSHFIYEAPGSLTPESESPFNRPTVPLSEIPGNEPPTVLERGSGRQSRNAERDNDDSEEDEDEEEEEDNEDEENHDEDKSQPKYVLKVLEGATPGKIYALGVHALTIGRDVSNTIQVMDDLASNYHAEIVRAPLGYVLADLGSTNGTRVRKKDQDEYEKIVKTPLAVGMRIRVGKTLLEFDNVGKQVEDSALSGGMALDPEKLKAKLAPAKSSRLFKFLLLAIIAGGIAATLFIVLKKPVLQVTPPMVPFVATNLIINGDFGQGTDDEGNPKHFRVQRDMPGIKVAVIPEADRGGEKGDTQKLGLQVSKNGAKSASSKTVVECAETLIVQPGRTYRLDGWMKNDGDGLYGLCITWIHGDRSFSENPVVLKDTQEWKEQNALLTPPLWADRARVGVFVQGREGKVWFDDLSLLEQREPATPAIPAVESNAVRVEFEGTKGAFAASLKNDVVLAGGTLMLVSPDESSACELASAVKPEESSKDGVVSFNGRIYDFALQELTNYSIQVQPASTGVALRVAVDRVRDIASNPWLRFSVVGPLASGDIEVSKGTETPERLAATKDQALTGVQGLILNIGKSPQLDITFTKASDVDLKRTGDRREITIKFKGELGLSLSPENAAQKQKMIAAMEEIKKSMGSGNWGAVETKENLFREKFADRFPASKDEAGKVQQQIDEAWKATQEEVKRAVKSAGTVDKLALAAQGITHQLEIWNGSEKRVAELHGGLEQLDAMRKGFEDEKAEQDADKVLQKAQTYMDNKAYMLAVPTLKASLIDNPTFAKTKAAAKAKELLPVAEAALQRKKDLDAINDRLKEKTQNFIVAKDFKAAIDAVEKDKEYQDNKADLQETNDLLTDWRKRAQN